MSLPNPAPLFATLRGIMVARTGEGLRQPEVDAINSSLELALQAPTVGHNSAASIQLGLTDQDFMAAEAALGATRAQVRAVWEVECSGQGWFQDVRGDILAADGPGGFIDGSALPKILFEAHHFSRLTGGRFDRSHPNISSPKWNRALYVGGQAEWLRLHQAMLLDARAALMSASVGGPQIMGFNFKLAGFNSVEEFWAAMKASERAHLQAFASFIINSGLVDELRQISNVHEACKPFARGYNGAGYAKNEYHIKLARAHKKWSAQ